MLLLRCLYGVRWRRRIGYIRAGFCSCTVFRRSSELQLLNPINNRLYSHQSSSAQERPEQREQRSGLATRKSNSRPRRTVCQLVLDQFNVKYREELGEQWESARNVLLDTRCWQYGVLLNRYSDHTDVHTHLISLGYYSLLPQPHASSIHGLLQCFIHKDALRLPTQRHRPGWLKQYYLLNAASLLPVLALGVRDGEKVLDLCSAPGGKALALLQTCSPGLLHCNEVEESRFQWLLKTLESYIPPSVRDTVTVTNVDGRTIGSSQPEMYDKVLVDAPCSNDRCWLYTPDALQGALWLKKQAQLPHLQKELLCSALSAVRPGGLVVYSTCTLSRAENQSVVEEVLASCPGVELVDLDEELIGSLSEHFTFARLQPQLGYLIIPEQGRTWGPMFVCRLRRIY